MHTYIYACMLYNIVRSYIYHGIRSYRYIYISYDRNGPRALFIIQSYDIVTRQPEYRYCLLELRGLRRINILIILINIPDIYYIDRKLKVSTNSKFKQING